MKKLDVIKKIVSLKQIVKELQSNNLLSAESALLFENMPDISKEMQKRSLKKNKYSPKLRQFAITLSFFSPKGYDYVRKVFNSCLPHRSTIGKWFQNIDAGPGFTKETLVTLRKYVQLSSRPVLLALIIDEISIRKLIEWD